MPEASKKNPLGPTGVVAARRVRELREAHGWTYKELSDRLASGNRPIPPLGLRRIEAEDRRIDADDLVALAFTLGVNPSALLLPLDSHGEVDISGAGRVPADMAWAWADGKRPLALDEDGQRDVAFQEHARPPKLRRFNFMTKAGRRKIGQIYDQVPGADVIRDDAGDVLEIKLPGGGHLVRGDIFEETGEGDGG